MAWFAEQPHGYDYVVNQIETSCYIVLVMSAETTPTEPWRRREAYLAPGRSIVMSLIPIEHVLIWDGFCGDTGLTGGQVISSIMCPVPVPVYPMPKSRPTAKASMLWHPLLWLPPHMAVRRDEDEAGDHDLYILRLALEIEETGLYDRESGTWLDVCSAVGIDLDDPDTLASANAWLGGSADPIFDDIDLTELTRDPQDPFWASDVAAANLQLWLEVVWSESASAQLETLTGLLDGSNGPLGADEAQNYLLAMAGISSTWFRRVPPIGSSRLPGRPSMVFGAMEERLKTSNLSVRELTNEIAPALRDAFLVIRDTFRPSVAKMADDEQQQQQLLALP